jgi:hypothetical protein
LVNLHSWEILFLLLDYLDKLIQIRTRREPPAGVNGCGTGLYNISSWTVNALPTATISYAGSPFCTSVASGSPTITVLTGGPFLQQVLVLPLD